MKKIILIGGDLASGKSTFSQIIAKRFNLSLFNKDVLKELLGSEIETHNRAENKKLSVCCYKFFKYMVEQNISPVIFESNFKDYELEELTPILENHDYDVLSLRLTGDYVVMHNRFINRLANRNPVHKSQNLDALEDYIAVIDDLRKAIYPGKVIEVNATTFDYQTDENIFAQIKEFLNK